MWTKENVFFLDIDLSGKELNDEEKEALEMIKKRRQNERRYRREFQDLLDRKANGEEVDEDRMYCLELFAREHVGEELTEAKFLDLEDYEKEEKKAQTSRSWAANDMGVSKDRSLMETPTGARIHWLQ